MMPVHLVFIQQSIRKFVGYLINAEENVLESYVSSELVSLVHLCKFILLRLNKIQFAHNSPLALMNLLLLQYISIFLFPISIFCIRA